MQQFIAKYRSTMGWVVLFSLGVNLLMLTTSLYLLQVFDRVLPSRSFDTLVFLTLIAVLALVALGVLEAVRRTVLGRLGTVVEQQLATPLLQQQLSSPQIQGRPALVRDLQTLRSYLSGQGPIPLLDLPWCGLFLVIIFILHSLLGWLALGSFLLLGAMALINERATREPLQQGSAEASHAAATADHMLANREAILSMGMAATLGARWQQSVELAGNTLQLGSRRQQRLAAAIKTLRFMIQLVVLGVGAVLAILGELTPGAMIAASILVARFLAPVEQGVATWSTTVMARAAWSRLTSVGLSLETGTATRLPRPTGHLKVDNLTYMHSGSDHPTLAGITLELKPGEALGLIGPTGSGKTSLARCLLGVEKPRLGEVRLDGIGMAGWSADDRGQYLGYLPQDIQLFEGTVAENIARFQQGDDEDVIAAARSAGAHETILALPQGYDTRVGPGGVSLSGGQRQRVALARALYGKPAFLVLDEPNANQDRAGEAALMAALEVLREQGVTFIVIAHRPALLAMVDKVLVLRAGRVAAFGPRDEVLSAVAPGTTIKSNVQVLRPGKESGDV